MALAHSDPTDVENALKSNSLLQLVLEWKAGGCTQAEAIERLTSFLERLPPEAEAEDDAIRDVLDFVTGFCSPHQRIFDSDPGGKPIAPQSGRYEVKVQAGGPPLWCALEYRAVPSDSFSITLAQGPDAESIRWFEAVRLGAGDGAAELRRGELGEPRLSIEITRIVAHPTDTTEAVCRTRGAGLVRELWSRASRPE
jgi:hypothetical protein